MPTYAALERGFRLQAEECRSAPKPQAIECREVFGTLTCTIAADPWAR